MDDNRIAFKAVGPCMNLFLLANWTLKYHSIHKLNPMNKKFDSVTAAPAFSPAIGQHIGAEAGAKMVKAFYDAHPEQAYGHLIGRDIIEKILAQPSCAGLSVHPGYNEEGVRQLVFTGVDAEGQQILQFAMIGENGKIQMNDGIVADKVITTPGLGETSYNWF
jgi:hypothetical protein